jgi:hypothetical protein
MRKRLFALVLSTVMVGAALSGCSSSSKTTETATTGITEVAQTEQKVKLN